MKWDLVLSGLEVERVGIEEAIGFVMAVTEVDLACFLKDGVGRWGNAVFCCCKVHSQCLVGVDDFNFGTADHCVWNC